MSRLLTGVTHAIVTVPKREDAHASNTFALVDLCFGPGDDTSISGLRYSRTEDGELIWQGPTFDVHQGGHLVTLPVFKGELLVETARLASASVARIKKELGDPQWGTRYRILRDRVLIEETKE